MYDEMASKTNTELQEKNKEIFKLRMKIHQILDQNQTNATKEYFHKENKALKSEIANTEHKQIELKDILKQLKETKEQQMKLKLKLESQLAINDKLNNELSSVHNDILNLSRTIKEMLKGNEPSIQSLWGLYGKEELPKTLNIEELRMIIESIRSDICDYYAESYSNTCALQ